MAGEKLLENIILKLKNIKISKLFGYLDYDIDLNLKDKNNISIIYGVNGQGKTTVFKLVNDIINCDYKGIDKIPFEKCELEFKNEFNSSNRKIIVEKEYTFSLFNSRTGLSNAKQFSNNNRLKLVSYYIDGKEYSIFIESKLFELEKKEILIFVSKNYKSLDKSYKIIGIELLNELLSSIQKSSFIETVRISNDEDDIDYKSKYTKCIRHIEYLIKKIHSGFIDNNEKLKEKEYKKFDELTEYDFNEYSKSKLMIDYLNINGWKVNAIDNKEAININKSYKEVSLLDDDIRNEYAKSIQYLYDVYSYYFNLETDDFMTVNSYISILNDNFLMYFNKRIGIDTTSKLGRLSFIYSKD